VRCAWKSTLEKRRIEYNEAQVALDAPSLDGGCPVVAGATQAQEAAQDPVRVRLAVAGILLPLILMSAARSLCLKMTSL